MKRLHFWFVGLLVGLFLVACSQADPTAVSEPESVEEAAPAKVTVRLMTHDSFDISEETLNAFTEQTGHTVEIVKAGDAGEMVNKAVLAKEAPLADVIFGIDNTFLSRALENDILVSYASPVLADIRPELQLDPENRALPVDFGDVCLNYDKAYFVENGLTPPQSLNDLIAPEYANLTAVQNPATSSPGLAFLLATIQQYGEEGYLDYWQQLKDNGVVVTNGWSEAYYGEFSATSDGTRPIVVSYASSPPAEVYFAEEELTEAPTTAVVNPGTCFRQVEFVGILQDAEQPDAAQALVDFLLSPTFQEDMPLHMFVYPSNVKATIPPIFGEFGAVPQEPATMDYERLSANRETWIEAWSEVVIR
jgi:thiamine transport system substrate-binding protein